MVSRHTLLRVLFLVTISNLAKTLAATVRTRRYVQPGNNKPPQTCASEIPGNCALSDGYVSENITLAPESTALVLVDVWNTTDPVLLDSYSTRLLPLLAAARKAGLLIVHAPSEGALLPSIHVLPGELLVVGEDGRANSSSRSVYYGVS